MKIKHTNIYRIIVSLFLAIIVLVRANAFDLSTYADNSVLADGKWVKISVAESGIYKITKTQLSQWGFNDPSRVRIYGYGGNRIPDELILDNYIDDLPLVQSALVGDGVVFYGVGPEKWEGLNGGYRRVNNVYTSVGYYFVTDKDVELRQIEEQGGDNGVTPVTTYGARLHYELDSYSPGEAGYILVGESFKQQNGRTFSFDMTDRVEGTDVWMETALVSKSYNASQVDYKVNSIDLPSISSDKIYPLNNSSYLHGDYIQGSRKFSVTGDKLSVRMNVQNITNVVNIWLDYISVNYTRNLCLPQSGYLNFWSDSPSLAMDAAQAPDAVVWDVTTPLIITKLRTSNDGKTISWGNDYSGMRTYAAWSPSGKLPSPKYEGVVRNQNLHSMENVEMVIFTLPELKSQADRLAKMHARAINPLKVAVLNVDDVYNEFASGSPDVSAIRKCLKMIYDRCANDSISLRYALLLGRATYDNRHLTSQFTGPNTYNTLPYYIGGTPKAQFSDNTAFGTDDFMAMLEDGSGTTLGLDDLCVGIGRIPSTSLSEAKNSVDKIIQYYEESLAGTWKNSFLFLADDGDNGVHAMQTEEMIKCFMDTPNQQAFFTKVYVDAYDNIGGECKGGRTEMFRLLDEGVAWWNYCGHANNHSWTAEGMLTYSDINNIYLKKVPMLMAATCDFLRWDSNTISGGEIMFNNRNGGIISAISATRPVYISDNGLFTKAIGRAITKRDSLGRLPRLGDIYRNAKNNIINDRGEKRTNPNRLRYVLMGDPALPLPMPNNLIKIDSIGGEALASDSQIIIQAMSQTVIKGRITTPLGELIEDFDGTIQINLYDAERSITTKGNGNENIVFSFDQHGEKLFSGLASVKGGYFALKVAMPGEVADNFRPAMMNMYAYTDDKRLEAVGINRDFYVYGYDETVEPDTEAPIINSLVLNHSSFNDGDVVNETPMVIAQISDNTAINVSAAGIGHQMVITLDGRTSYNDVSLFFTPSADGTPSGEIRYPMNALMPGDHTLTLKVWDTAANSATQEINFKVKEGLDPVIFKVYTDVNPASTEVNFYVDHNRPDAEITATVTVYDLLGHQLWETTAKGVSNMFTTQPITWDLCDASGRRLPRGIYLYRASISTDNGENYTSEARRLAVTAY